VGLHVILDLSRLLARAGRPAATGIDRVELAYAKHFGEQPEAPPSFAAVTAIGRFGPIPAKAATRFVELLEERWRTGRAGAARHALAAAGRLQLHAALSGERRLYAQIRTAHSLPVYLLVSHHHLDRPALIVRLKQRTGARFVPFVHDLIPSTFPEYVRPGHAERHRRRLLTVARLADAVIVNSTDTRAQLAPLLIRQGRSPAVVVAPLGVDLPIAERSPDGDYFVCVGTIEPRKNLLLLLNLWRRLGDDRGPTAPRLVLVGRRGWENENVRDMIERSPSIRRLVVEHRAMGDRDMVKLLAGARALLMPSFAEGYGLPVAEALSLGTPVLCSDLPALRAVGKDVPEYLDPLDGLGWLRAIEDYAQDSARRRAQLERLAGWQAPRWPEHFATLRRLLDDLVRDVA
jgi:glycosyltransferase involved in cell wall biosynthesis